MKKYWVAGLITLVLVLTAVLTLNVYSITDNVAVYLKKSWTCDIIHGETSKEICYSKVAAAKGDPTLCNKIQNQDNKDNCYKEVAVAKIDLTVCDNIQDIRSSICKLTVICEADENQRKKLCEEMSEKHYPENYQNSCGKSVLACDSINEAISACEQDYLCLTESALLRAVKDPDDASEICDRLQEQSNRDECYRGVAKVSGNTSICNKIPRQLYRGLCYWDVAVARRDPLICDKIKDQSYRDRCYYSIALNKEELPVCEKIQEPGYKYGCFLEIAKAKKNISICDQIQAHSIKHKCYREVIETVENITL